MKKVLVTLSIVLALSLNVNAQSDGFFSSNNGISNYRSSDETELTPMLPARGLNTNQDADAPLGSGLLLLAGLGLAYGISRKK